MVSTDRSLGRALLIALALAGCGASSRAPLDGRAVASALEDARQRSTVEADDGHAVTLWSKLPEGEPKDVIVLVHGRTWSGGPDFDLEVPSEPRYRRSLMEQLRARGWATYAVDLRGYGATPRDASGWLTPERAAADLRSVVAEVRRRHGREPVVLGWSNGALVAQLAAQTKDAGVRTLVLYGYPRDPTKTTEFGEIPEEPPRAATTAEAAASDFVTEGAIDREGIDAFVAAALAADPVRVDWRALDEWNHLDAAKIALPTLLIRGVDDPIATADIHARVHDTLASACKRAVTLERSDHAAHLERIEAFVDTIESFMTHCD